MTFLPQQLDLFRPVEDYAVFLLDPQGHVRTWNTGGERIKGYRADEIIGKHFSAFYPPEESGQADVGLRTAAETGHFDAEGWRVRKDGQRFWGSVSLTAVRDETGEVSGFIEITRDLTERKLAEERLRTNDLKFQLLMAGVQEYAIFLMDPEGRVTDWNAAAERVLGYKADEIVGQSFAVFFTPEEGEPGGVAERELRLAASVGRASDDRWHVRKDGTHFWANGLTSALRDEDGSLKGFAKVLSDRTERKRFEEELRAKADALEEADRRKNEFLAMLAHELRNPLSPIASAVALLEHSESLGEEERSAIGIADRQVKKLTRLINDLMDVSRITSGKVHLNRERIDLRDVLRGVVAAAKPGIDEHGHTLVVSLPEHPLWLSADATRLEQVFENLLGNATKYTPHGGRIEVAVARQDGTAVVAVRDNGVGIAPELLPMVFDLFTQADRSLDRSQGGLGIGLTIVKTLVEMHDGQVEATTGGLGKGSEFAVKLPLLAVRSTPRPETSGPTNEAAPRRILVVDDNADAAKMLSLLLRASGNEVETALCGLKAIEAAVTFRPEVILLDIGLPGLDGYEVARRLREQAETKDVVLVAITGYGQPEDREKSKAAGFNHHLVKPVSIEDVLAVLMTHDQP
ncbi:MAG: PAS domain S-box protein [Planctomycetaceae bacterium]|nr:PAS domain S-box protein [Planctomycetaceae bacterium]